MTTTTANTGAEVKPVKAGAIKPVVKAKDDDIFGGGDFVDMMMNVFMMAIMVSAILPIMPFGKKVRLA